MTDRSPESIGGALDLLLEATREPLPADDGFVSRVMADVRSSDQRRWGRRALRRPMVFGIAAAVLATGGAVAAVVGTNPTHRDEAQPSQRPATAIVRPSVPVTPLEIPEVSAPSIVKPSEPAPVVQKARGFLTEHTAFVFDQKTGLRLETETYSTEFTVNKEHRVTVTLENTSAKPITFSSTRGCAIQVMAFPADENEAVASLNPDDYAGRFEWECAGSSGDPRSQRSTSERFVLAPGDRMSSDAYLTLSRPGEWKVVGKCTCTYESVEGSPGPKSGILRELFDRTLPSPLLPERTDGANLITPAITAEAKTR